MNTRDNGTGPPTAESECFRPMTDLERVTSPESPRRPRGLAVGVAAGGGRACHDAGMQVIVVGAGQVGHTVVKSLAETHECTVIDIDQARLEAVSHAYDVRVTH